MKLKNKIILVVVIILALRGRLLWESGIRQAVN